jgi:hypothetical protein
LSSIVTYSCVQRKLLPASLLRRSIRAETRYFVH